MYTVTALCQINTSFIQVLSLLFFHFACTITWTSGNKCNPSVHYLNIVSVWRVMNNGWKKHVWGFFAVNYLAIRTLYPLAQIMFHLSSGIKCQVFTTDFTFGYFYLEANAGKQCDITSFCNKQYCLAGSFVCWPIQDTIYIWRHDVMSNLLRSTFYL